MEKVQHHQYLRIHKTNLKARKYFIYCGQKFKWNTNANKRYAVGWTINYIVNWFRKLGNNLATSDKKQDSHIPWPSNSTP